MSVYDMRCGAGHVFEVEAGSAMAEAAACPACGAAAARLWTASFGLGGFASPGPSRDQMPRSWEAVRRGDPSTVRGWHKLATAREKLEEKHPELAGDRRPFIAHEGTFEHKPLRAGDPLPGSVERLFSGGGVPKRDMPAGPSHQERRPAPARKRS